MNKKGEVIKINKRRKLNIGVIIFLFILVYLLINIYIFLTRTSISIYEVQTGNIFSTLDATGIIVRSESEVKALRSGYILYFRDETDRVYKTGILYGIGNTSSYSADVKYETNSTLRSKIKDTIYEYLTERTSFSEVYSLRERLSALYIQSINDYISREFISSGGTIDEIEGIRLYTAEESGMVSYVTDELCGISRDDINEQTFGRDITSTYLKTFDNVEYGTSICRLVPDDSWEIIVLLTKEQYNRMLDKKYVDFSINKGTTINAPIELYEKDGAYFAAIMMNRYAVDYIDERKLLITFELENEEGLKIPLSALGSKEYYRIPSSYFIKGGNSSEYGLNIYEADSNGVMRYNFYITPIFLKQNGFYYIDAALFDKNLFVLPADSSERFPLNLFVINLEGVYNVNDGYAVFKRVERISSGSEYCLVKKNQASSISAYDHIALDAASAVEGALIY